MLQRCRFHFRLKTLLSSFAFLHVRALFVACGQQPSSLQAETEIVTETKETQECEATDAPETTDAPVEVPQPKLPAEDEETVTTLPKDDDSPVMEDKVEGPKEVPLCSLCGWSIRDISK